MLYTLSTDSSGRKCWRVAKTGRFVQYWKVGDNPLTIKIGV